MNDVVDYKSPLFNIYVVYAEVTLLFKIFELNSIKF